MRNGKGRGEERGVGTGKRWGIGWSAELDGVGKRGRERGREGTPPGSCIHTAHHLI